MVIYLIIHLIGSFLATWYAFNKIEDVLVGVEKTYAFILSLFMSWLALITLCAMSKIKFEENEKN